MTGIALGVCMPRFALAVVSTASASLSPDANYLPCMLQLDVSMTDRCGRLLEERCDPSANFPCSNNCPIHMHGADCYRPIPEVMAEHPGVDGYCYFNATAFWLVYPGQMTMVEAANDAIKTIRGADYQGDSRGMPIHYRLADDAGEASEEITIWSHMDSAHYLYDDLYGYSLGVLQGQGLDTQQMFNSTSWTARSQEMCAHIQRTYQFSKEELVLADALDGNQALVAWTKKWLFFPGAGHCQNWRHFDAFLWPLKQVSMGSTAMVYDVYNIL